MLAPLLTAALLQTAPLEGISNQQCNASAPLSIAQLVDHWRASAEIGFGDRDYTLIGGTPQAIHAGIVRCDADPADAICPILGAEFSLILERANALADQPTQPEGRLVAVRNVRLSGRALLEQPEAFEVRCDAPTPPGQGQQRPTPPGASAAAPPQWRVALDLASLRKPERNLREFATFSFTDNVKEDTETREIEFAVGRRYSAADGTYAVMPYISVERQTQRSQTPEEENQVQLGLDARVRLGSRPGRRFGFLSADLAYLTDDSLEASGVRYGLTYTPSLQIPGYQAFYAVTYGGPLEFVWTFDARLDHLNIDEVGDAFEGTEDEATRIGADLAIALRTTDPVAGITPQVSLAYGVREPFDSEDRSLSHFRAALDFLPEKDGVFSFGVAYESGEDFDSLKFSQQWTARVGYRY